MYIIAKDWELNQIVKNMADEATNVPPEALPIGGGDGDHSYAKNFSARLPTVCISMGKVFRFFII